MPARARSRWIVAAKWLVVALVAWGIHRTALSGWKDLQAQDWNVADLRPEWLAAAGVLYLAGLLPSGVFWQRVLWALGQKPRLGETLRAYYIGHVGKYVPGKGFVVVLRAGLVRSPRTGTAMAAVSIFYETLTMMAVGALVAAAVLAVVERGWLTMAAGGLMAVVALPTWPPVFERLVRLTGIGKLDPRAVERLAGLDYRTIGIGWLTLPAGWLLMGASLWATFRAGGYAGASALDGVEQLAICTAAASLAVVAGFVSFVPGGLVVREAIVLHLLTPAFGEAAALVAAVLSRLISVAAETLVAGGLYLLPRRDGEP